MRRFLKWASYSLAGHIVLLELAFALPLFAYFSYQRYWQGTLTFGWAMYALVVTGALGMAVAAAGWFTVTRGLIEKHRKN